MLLELHMSLLSKKDLPILFVEVVPPAKGNTIPMIEKQYQEKYSQNTNISYEIISGREFWLNSLEYSQVSMKLYESTINWLTKSRNKN